MAGIWLETDEGLEPLRAQPFVREKALHDSIERAAAMLPLPGQPRLVMLGREVALGNGYADLGGSRVLVPQLVEPQRVSAASVSPAGRVREAKPTRGWQPFADSVEKADPAHRELLRRLCEWAQRLESDGLATLFTTVGKGRWVLNPRLPGQSRGLVTIWNDGGGYISPQRSVIAAEAPETLARLDEHMPGEIRNNNYITSELDEEVLGLLAAAYAEARSTGGAQDIS
ncbi:hypothetical protein ACFY4C_03960 [Actinomadura viridis]|uniref:hypothetical protein n=1 Tax=Actinomadura viridis TaxID=58110 RepID=UPI00369BDEC4